MPFLLGDEEPRGACWDFGWLAALLPLPLLIDHVQIGVVDLDEERRQERSKTSQTMRERFGEEDDELPPERYLLNAVTGRGTSLSADEGVYARSIFESCKCRPDIHASLAIARRLTMS